MSEISIDSVRVNNIYQLESLNDLFYSFDFEKKETNKLISLNNDFFKKTYN